MNKLGNERATLMNKLTKVRNDPAIFTQTSLAILSIFDISISLGTWIHRSFKTFNFYWSYYFF